MFLQPEPWTEQYFEPVNHLTDKIIPIDDVTAYDMYPHLRWVYNKMNLCSSQGIPHGPEGTRWISTPSISKPITNLWGMSIGVYTLTTTWNQFNEDSKQYRAGNFWMPLFNGTHYSTDFVLVDGIVKWHITFKGHSYTDLGTFSHWELIELPSYVYHYITDWIKRNIKSFTGIINVESIDEKIIECHLRLSPQFVNLYCSTNNWLIAVSHLYDSNEWHYNFPLPKSGYSVVLWTENSGIYHIDDSFLNLANQMVENVVITFTPGYDIKNETGTGKQFRLAVANGWSYEFCCKALELIKQNIVRVG